MNLKLDGLRKNFLTCAALAALIICSGSSTTAVAEDLIARGKIVFNGNGACASCHGALGKGDGPAAAALNPKPKDISTGEFSYDTDGDGKTGTETDLFNIITHGAQKYGGSMFMVGRPDLPEEDRKALVAYVLSLKDK